MSAHKIENIDQAYSENGVNIGILSEKKWTIAGIVVFTLLVTLGYIFIATPIYMTDALLQVEEKAPLKQELGTIISEQLLSDEISTGTEIEIIRSRNIMGRIVDKLKLDIFATPCYFPIIGKAIARNYANASGKPADPFMDISLMDISRFAWGGERIRVDIWEVPDNYLDKEFKIVAGENKKYLLYDPEGNLVLNAVTGEIAHSAKPGKNSAVPSVSILVSDLQARKNTEFLIKKISFALCLKNLHNDFKIYEMGKKNSQTGILFMSLEGDDKGKIVQILNTLMEIYVRQNFEKKSLEIAKTLNFIKSQLPDIKEKLNAAEAKLNEYKLKYGHIDLDTEAKALIDKIAAVKRQLSVLELQHFDYAKKYTPKHRSMLVLKQKINQLNAELKSLNSRLKTLPNIQLGAIKAQLGAIKAQRDVKVYEELYLLLLNKSQELMMAQASISGNARIIDPAIMPNKPVWPQKPVILIIGFLTGLFAGVSVVIIRSAFFASIDNPAIIEQQLKLPVYTVIPYSPNQKKTEFLAAQHPEDIAIESLRSLRTGLLFDLPESTGNIVSFTGASPQCGKSFVALNFSHIIAETGKRVLLIDADLRRGQLHKYLNCKRSPGLTDLITEKADPDETIHIESDVFSFLPTGQLPTNPSELLLFKQFELLLNNVSKQFDLVVIDSPPSFLSDSLTIARLAGINFYILRPKQNSVREIKQNLNQLSFAGVTIQGCILNAVKLTRHQYGYGYAKYKY